MACIASIGAHLLSTLEKEPLQCFYNVINNFSAIAITELYTLTYFQGFIHAVVALQIRKGHRHNRHACVITRFCGYAHHV